MLPPPQPKNYKISSAFSYNFKLALTEMARRGIKRKVMQKTGKTEQGKYSAKYALSELLVCGECGTPYKRCTWARNGKKRIVWRCVSRLEFGTKYCHTSPTLDEDKLHRAILEAINGLDQTGQEITEEFLDIASLVQQGQESGGVDPLALRQRLAALTAEQAKLAETTRIIKTYAHKHYRRPRPRKSRAGPDITYGAGGREAYKSGRPEAYPAVP